jgi:hypothetical protein
MSGQGSAGSVERLPAARGSATSAAMSRLTRNGEARVASMPDLLRHCPSGLPRVNTGASVTHTGLPHGGGNPPARHQLRALPAPRPAVPATGPARSGVGAPRPTRIGRTAHAFYRSPCLRNGQPFRFPVPPLHPYSQGWKRDEGRRNAMAATAVQSTVGLRGIAGSARLPRAVSAGLRAILTRAVARLHKPTRPSPAHPAACRCVAVYGRPAMTGSWVMVQWDSHQDYLDPG